MENHAIAAAIDLTASLMELHGQDEFRIRNYRQGVLKVEQVTQPLATLDEKGVIDALGKSIGTAAWELISTGSFAKMAEMVEATPPGVIQMLQIKGLGPKKVKALWKDGGIDSKEALMQACLDNRIAKMKGFGEKSQESIRQALIYEQANRGKLHWATAEELEAALRPSLLALPAIEQAEPTGQLRVLDEIVNRLEWVIAGPSTRALHEAARQLEWLELDEEASALYRLVGKVKDTGTDVWLHLCKPAQLASTLLLTSAEPAHLARAGKEGVLGEALAKDRTLPSEEAYYQKLELPYIVPEMRLGTQEWEWAQENQNSQLVTMAQIKGCLHNHSTYSDGQHSLREMAQACIDMGLEYLGICDHSKTATYAGGLDEDAVHRQHDEIDRLNQELAPFKIFKGIESDILPDGSLDYMDGTLARFDFIVASVHAGLSMDQAKATQRLLTAIQNPYTTMIGHISTRLLLRREGFPVDYDAIFEACRQHRVILELNASAYRLDLDWRYLPQYLRETGLPTSINPDAHATTELAYMKYGVNVARKAGVLGSQVLNTLSLAEITDYFASRKAEKGI